MTKKILYGLLLTGLMAACGTKFTVEGTSNVSMLDGRMLYLEVLEGLDFKRIDSCEIVHGKFHFGGTCDTVRIANIAMDDESVMPLILEGGHIVVQLNTTGQTITGTPLNEELDSFLTRYNQIKNDQLELIHRHDQAIMDGLDMAQVTAELNAEAARLETVEDKFLMDFVSQNFDNILGPGVFFMLTASTPYPMLTPWIEDLMSKATDKFKNDPYVKDFYQKARENEEIMNGLKDSATEPAAQQPAPPAPQPVAPAPTPADLAKPAQ